MLWRSTLCRWSTLTTQEEEVVDVVHIEAGAEVVANQLSINPLLNAIIAMI